MKKTLTLRTQLIALMALLVILQSLALLVALSVAGVYFKLDAEAFRLFNDNTSVRMQTFNRSVGELVGNMASEAQRLNKNLQSLLPAGATAQQLYADNKTFDDATLVATDSLISILRNNNVTGAFAIMGGSNSNKQNPDAHSAIYIRNSAPDSYRNDNSNFLLELGSIDISRQHKITTSVNWDLDIVFARNSSRYEYYDRPMAAARQDPGAEIERYGYWAAPSAILKDNQQVVSYTLPLLADDGTPFGVVGFEISLAYFNQFYLPNMDLPYQNSFYIITIVHDDAMDLAWFIPSGPLAQVYLQRGDVLPLQPVTGSSVFSTQINGLGEMYCATHTLEMYSRNSPFYDDGWTLVGFVPQKALHETSSGVRNILLASILGTTLVAFAAIILLSRFSTRKIARLSKHIRGLNPYQEIYFEPTGMREVDDLTAAVEMLSKSVISASKTTSKILELTLLPLGGYELSKDSDHVVLTEYVYQLLDLAPGTSVRKADWREYYQQLTAQPAGEDYENIYRYPPEGFGNSKWLRILQATSDGSEVGVILDVSKDVEERRRLAWELDFDLLTHLYNRSAFKRESHRKIQEEPDKIGVLIFSDLDNLKYINDTFGHDTGDRLIIRAGEMFREFERVGGVVSRISGDEFAIYLHGFTSKDDARALIHRQLEENAAYSLMTPDGSSHPIRSSSGIAWYPEDTDNITDLLKLADFAMYEAKHSRKGSLFEFSQEAYRDKAYLRDNREAIYRLLDEGLIRFAFQPIVDLKTGDVYAYEALMRPMLSNFRSPAEILSVAADQSKLPQLERLVMLTAFQTISENIALLGDTKIFVNSIPSQVLAEEDRLFLNRRYGHLYKNVVVEITEAENDSPKRLSDKVSFIHDNGMLLAIDDFGSGYSNELRILSMQPDVIKVDMELIQGIAHNVDKQQLVQNLISFCHPKGICLIAEGVEVSEDLAALVAMGMDYVQGYYTGKPAFEFLPVQPEIRDEILQLQRSLQTPAPAGEDGAGQ